MELLLAAIVWYLIGVSAVKFLYDKYGEVTLGEFLMFGLVGGILGPINFLTGWWVCTDKDSIVLFRKKEKK